MNSYDLGVDIELYDAVQRLRFEHPEVRAVVLTGGLDKMFCAGREHPDAGAVHARVEGELLQVHQRDAQRASRTRRRAAGRPGSRHSTARRPAAATSWLWPATRSCSSTTAPRRCRLPEVPLLGVLPGTGGLTRVVDKRHVRKDRADLFATKSEGYRGSDRRGVGPRRRAPPPARAGTRRSPGARGPPRTPPRGARRAAGSSSPRSTARESDDTVTYPYVTATLDRDARRVDITVAGPTDGAARRRRRPCTPRVSTTGRSPWPARSTTWSSGCAPTSPTLGTWVLRTARRPRTRSSPTTPSSRELADDWFVHETAQYLKRTLQAARRHQPEPGRGHRARQLLRRPAPRARRSPATGSTCSRASTRTSTPTPTPAASCSPTPTTAASRWATASPAWQSRFWGHDDDLDAARGQHRRAPRRRGRRRGSGW